LTHLTDLYVIISPFTRIGEFVCGMLAGRLFILLNAGKIFDGRFWWTGFEIVSIAFSWYCATHALLLPNWIAGRDLGPSIWNTYLSSCGAAPGFTLLIVVFAFQKGVISKAIAVWPLVVLGEMSFAIYLEHQILLRYLFSHHTIFSHLPDKVQCIVYCGLVLGLAFVLWSFVEKPSRDFIRKAYLYRQQRAANKLLVTA
jgi:peptidoglycan/LPS O-acetylase OafA/YrhL